MLFRASQSSPDSTRLEAALIEEEEVEEDEIPDAIQAGPFALNHAFKPPKLPSPPNPGVDSKS